MESQESLLSPHLQLRNDGIMSGQLTHIKLHRIFDLVVVLDIYSRCRSHISAPLSSNTYARARMQTVMMTNCDVVQRSRPALTILKYGFWLTGPDKSPPHLSMTPPILMALFQSFRVAFPEMCTNCFGLISWSSYQWREYSNQFTECNEEARTEMLKHHKKPKIKMTYCSSNKADNG